ncbi:flagellar hook protein FlgE [Xylophilus sp.]|uniref:flagellar hook protein FlgE n=1 Tax=Xylophilus sp. TaxID=2653893 RepID=UPI0013BD9629|nr:flagellar hook protein FlgE [Xylophilus sp.]KAF1044613.1 MAG: Flagellar hook protein FlgE [Xylophilus sp.]
MSFQQGLSGLNAASKNLDVIGHNIANANTTGFKSSRAEFAELIATAGKTGGSSSGIGVEVQAVAQQFDQGNVRVTGNSLDVAINGNGFFALQQTDGSLAYSRAGDFKLDTSGNLVTNDASKVLGYTLDPDTGLRTSSSTVPLVFPTSAPIAAKQTTKITASFNLDARATDAAGDATATPPVAATPRSTYSTSLNVYDSQGVAKPVSLYFEKNGNNTWNVYDSLDTTATAVGQLVFDDTGAIVSGFSLTLSVAPTPPNPNNLAAYNVTLDFADVSQYGSKFSVSDLSQDGYASGELTGINIEDDGTITTRYSNGVSRAEGQVALASFRNTQGLASIGGNKWVETSTSGQATYGTPTDGSFGALRSGALEDSNVDLTAELVNMMTAQRNYQANAQTIKTQDQIMSTLVNLR